MSMLMRYADEDTHLAVAGVDGGVARQRPLRLTLGESEVLLGGLLVEDVAPDLCGSARGGGLERSSELWV